jgi:ABC-type dipeptide/oligopeptide/nickel transport system permease subunit
MEMAAICQEMWFAMLESAKDRVLGVDTLGQQVLPRVWYGKACLLIRAAIDCESCSVVWGKM